MRKPPDISIDCINPAGAIYHAMLREDKRIERSFKKRLKKLDRFKHKREI